MRALSRTQRTSQGLARGRNVGLAMKNGIVSVSRPSVRLSAVSLAEIAVAAAYEAAKQQAAGTTQAAVVVNEVAEAVQDEEAEAVDASTASITAGAADQEQEEELVTQEFTEEETVYEKPITLKSAVTDAGAWLRTTNPGKVAIGAVAAVAVGTFAIACYRYYEKYMTPENVRKRQVSRNKLLVEELGNILPDKRSQLTPGFVRSLKGKTGFSMTEMYRKYLWYLLRERKFDQAAVDDLVALKQASGLSDQEVAEALKERAQRIYDKYGTLMVNTEGMTGAGILRKATCQALFRKLLFLTEHEPLIKQGTAAADSVDLRHIFGATEEDIARLRIVSLYEGDIDLERVLTVDVASDDDDSSAPKQAAESTDTPAQPPEAPKQ